MYEVRCFLPWRPFNKSLKLDKVEMIRDLVLYFLKQGIYSGPGDIAVLCAYLGQLQKLRKALKDLKISVSVDERDEEQLAKNGMEGDTATSAFEEVLVTKHVCSMVS